MVLTRLCSFALFGGRATRVEVEVDVISSDKPALIIVGLPDAAVKEAKERVLAAIRNSGFSLQGQQITVNLAPSDLKKEGTLYDFPIAVGVLAGLKLVDSRVFQGFL
jgi:Predicted ATPase with chaperone activity